MPFTSSRAYRLGLLALGVRTVWADCESFGMDYQNGGSYFQNSLSSDPFTFVSEFEGCNNDTANNIFVDPSGDQFLCSNTQLTPDDTDQLSICPLTDTQLSSGDYSLIIISNNGNGDPIAYERDFSLSVGPQSTSTVTPTVTVPVIFTPVHNVTSTTTDIVITALSPKTVTSASTTVRATVTITPKTVTKTTTKNLLTLSLTKYAFSIIKTTKTVSASCHTPTRQARADPRARITPTIIKAAAFETPKSKFRRVPGGGIDFDRAGFIKERSERLAAQPQRRAPDPQPLLVTDTNTADWITVSSTSTAATVTATITTETVVTSTQTPAPITVLSGTATAPPVTVTAPAPTKTKTVYTIGSVWATKTSITTVTITTKTFPAASKTACRKLGGTFY